MKSTMEPEFDPVASLITPSGRMPADAATALPPPQDALRDEEAEEEGEADAGEPLLLPGWPKLESFSPDREPTPVLEVQNVSMSFGGIRALSQINLQLRRGDITALIGPNGAGKTTLFNCITCIYKPTSGAIYLSQPKKSGDKLIVRKKLTSVRPHEATALGMARTFQNIRLFPAMTVLENVMVGRHCRTGAGVMGALFRPSGVRLEEESIAERSYQLLKYMGLHRLYAEKACNLSYGQQRRLEIARALATDPFLLLLDEPAAGMNPMETAALSELIRQIRDEFGLSILLIEHDMGLVMNLSDTVYVMEYGRLIAQGTPQEVRSNPRVIKAYLGEEDA